eukprot:scaffold9920_cov32-Tisochrysis_lutea.AAC.5
MLHEHEEVVKPKPAIPTLSAAPVAPTADRSPSVSSHVERVASGHTSGLRRSYYESAKKANTSYGDTELDTKIRSTELSYLGTPIIGDQLDNTPQDLDDNPPTKWGDGFKGNRIGYYRIPATRGIHHRLSHAPRQD